MNATTSNWNTSTHFTRATVRATVAKCPHHPKMRVVMVEPFIGCVICKAEYAKHQAIPAPTLSILLSELQAKQLMVPIKDRLVEQMMVQPNIATGHMIQLAKLADQMIRGVRKENQ